MTNTNDRNILYPAIFVALAITIGPGLGGYFIGRSLERFNQYDRTVLVKGISEREVKSDLAVWNLGFKDTDDTLSILMKRLEKAKKFILDFLKKQGLAESEIMVGETVVTNKLADDPWNRPNDEQKISSRYVASFQITVRTHNVDIVQKSLGNLGELAQKEVIVHNSTPSYYFTKLVELRPQMLAEAIQTARKSALQFSADSKSTISGIKTANQGCFKILGSDSFDDSNSYYEDSRSLMKKIRVVSTITFSLK